ncbi:30S ribosomal protein S20 [bacterium]|nr:30S ribosomal protein S20 [bacterium]
MANHKSSKKRIIRNEKKRLENKSRMSKIRTFVKKVTEALNGNKDKAEVQKALSEANSQLAKGVKKGIVSKKKMARTMSKFAHKLNDADKK